MRTFVVGLTLAGAFSALPLSALAQVSVNINVPGVIAVAPPRPRVEYIPAPRPGQVWVQGNWYWHEGDYAWRPGYWQRARPDYAWAPGRWVPVGGGYRWVEGNWKPHKKDKHYKHYDRHDDDHGHKHGHGHGHGRGHGHHD